MGGFKHPATWSLKYQVLLNELLHPARTGQEGGLDTDEVMKACKYHATKMPTWFRQKGKINYAPRSEES